MYAAIVQIICIISELIMVNYIGSVISAALAGKELSSCEKLCVCGIVGGADVERRDLGRPLLCAGSCLGRSGYGEKDYC